MSAASGPSVQGVFARLNTCWELRDGLGMAWDPNDGAPHYGTADSALGDAKEGYAPAEMEHPCWSAACAECDYGFDEDEYVMHFDSAEQALELVRDCDWTVEADRLLCPECQISRPSANAGSGGAS